MDSNFITLYDHPNGGTLCEHDIRHWYRIQDEHAKKLEVTTQYGEKSNGPNFVVTGLTTTVYSLPTKEYRFASSEACVAQWEDPYMLPLDRTLMNAIYEGEIPSPMIRKHPGLLKYLDWPSRVLNPDDCGLDRTQKTTLQSVVNMWVEMAPKQAGLCDPFIVEVGMFLVGLIYTDSQHQEQARIYFIAKIGKDEAGYHYCIELQFSNIRLSPMPEGVVYSIDPSHMEKKGFLELSLYLQNHARLVDFSLDAINNQTPQTV